jgi:hypothetical protein
VSKIIQGFKREYNTPIHTYCHSHIGSLLFHQEDKLGIARYVFNLINIGRNSLASNSHFGTIDKVSILLKLNPSHHESLVTGDDIQIRASTSNHGGHVIEYAIRIALINKEFHVGIKQIPFGNVNPFHQDGMQEL